MFQLAYKLNTQLFFTYFLYRAKEGHVVKNIESEVATKSLSMQRW